MSATFTEGAHKLSGLVPRLLGWRPGDFWDATPAELAAILAVPDATLPAPFSRTDLNALMERERDG